MSAKGLVLPPTDKLTNRLHRLEASLLHGLHGSMSGRQELVQCCSVL